MSDDLEVVTANGAVRETRELMEAYYRPDVREITEPGTGQKALVSVGGDGVTHIGRDAFDEYREAPVRRKGTATVTDLDSFIAHVDRFKDGDSAVFADDDRSEPSLTAVLDYHAAGADGAPRFGGHRTRYAFPFSDEWKAWSESDAKPMSMVEFAAFLEDHIVDVLADDSELPADMQKFVDAVGGKIASPTKLMEIAVNLQVHEKSTLREATKLSSGEAELSFQSEHTDASGKPLKVPSLFLIGVPVFRNGDPWRIAVRFRYRKTQGGVLFFYEMWRPDRVFDAAFKEACDKVREATGLPLLMGQPE